MKRNDLIHQDRFPDHSEVLLLPDMLKKAVEDNPHHTAIIDGNKKVTYQQLWDQGVNLSVILEQSLPKSDAPILVIMGDFIDNIITYLGLILANKAISNLNPDTPSSMISTIVKDLECESIITDSSNSLQITPDLSEVSVYCYSDLVDKSAVVDIGEFKLNEDQYFVLFTSGSEGAPKGVVRTLRVLSDNLLVRSRLFPLINTDRVMVTYDLQFARTLDSVWSALISGASVYPYNAKTGLHKLPNWIIDNQISVIVSISSMIRGLNSIVEKGTLFPSVRLIRIGGEPIFKGDLELLKQFFPQKTNFWISYGSTETSTICSNVVNVLEELDSDVVPVGFPLEGKIVEIVDDEGIPVGEGETGNILVKSEALASGYWNDPKLTAAKFYKDDLGKNVFRVGDQGKWLSNGMLQLIGRNDQMVKIRGYRVEISTVQSSLMNITHVIDAAVVTKTNKTQNQELVAFVVIEKLISTEDIRNNLEKLLPPYMIPSHIRIVEHLPKLLNGKIDRQALKEWVAQKSQDSDVETDNIKLFLKGLWENLLERNEISVTDNFFHLGGDSISCAIMLSEVEKKFRIELDGYTFIADPTISCLMDVVKNQIGKEVSTPSNISIEGSLGFLMEEMESRDGRDRLLKSRKVKYRRRSFLKRGVVIDKLLRTVLRSLPYSTSVDLASLFLSAGLYRFMSPNHRRAIVTKFNQVLGSEKTLHRCKLFDVINRYGIKPSAEAISYNGNRSSTRVSLSVENMHMLEESLQLGKGVLIVGSHTAANKFLKYLDLEIFTIGDVRLLLRAYNLSTKENELSLLSHRFNMGKKLLNQGKMVQVVADGFVGRGSGVKKKVLQSARYFYTGFAELALMTRPIVIPTKSYMIDPHTVVIRFDEPMNLPSKSIDHDKAIDNLLDQYVEVYSDLIRKYPWQVSFDHQKRFVSGMGIEA